MMAEDNPQENTPDRAHRLLIERVLDGTYPPGSMLPGERALSQELGLARNALREALQRLGHNGWLEISQGKATRVRDFRRDGNLMVLMDLLAVDEPPLDFMMDLLVMWSLLARDYTLSAVHSAPWRVAERLELYDTLADTPEACTRAMWQLHRALIDYGDNGVYGLVFNSFGGLYERVASRGFARPERRERARVLWRTLREAANEQDAEAAAELMRDYLLEDAESWRSALRPTQLEATSGAEEADDES
jgi:GntR family transcriptional regulator, negative regulator for fad regulon and positive regulator of fabA